MTEVKKRNMAKRVICYILGTVVMYIGIAMSIRADIGVAPASTIPYAASRLSPLSIGMCSALFNILCVLTQLAITRRMTLKLAFQIPMSYVLGFMLDVFYRMLDIPLPGLIHRVLFLISGLIIFSLGIRIIVGADLMIMPPDGLALTLGKAFGWPMSKGKLVFDIIVVAFTALLTLIMVGNAFLVVGVGTVICAAGTGPIIGLFTKLLPFFDVRVLEQADK